MVEPTGVDPDLLRPLDRLLVYQLAESRVIADRARAEQFRHLVVVLARLRDDRHAGRDRPGLDQAGRAEPRRTTDHACRHGVDRHLRFGRRRPPDGGGQPRRGRTQPGGTATEARSARWGLRRRGFLRGFTGREELGQHAGGRSTHASQQCVRQCSQLLGCCRQRQRRNQRRHVDPHCQDHDRAKITKTFS